MNVCMYEERVAGELPVVLSGADPPFPSHNTTQTGPQNSVYPHRRLARPLTLSCLKQYSVGYYVLQLHQKEGVA